MVNSCKNAARICFIFAYSTLVILHYVKVFICMHIISIWMWDIILHNKTCVQCKFIFIRKNNPTSNLVHMQLTWKNLVCHNITIQHLMRDLGYLEPRFSMVQDSWTNRIASFIQRSQSFVGADKAIDCNAFANDGLHDPFELHTSKMSINISLAFILILSTIKTAFSLWLWREPY